MKKPRIHSHKWRRLTNRLNNVLHKVFSPRKMEFESNHFDMCSELYGEVVAATVAPQGIKVRAVMECVDEQRGRLFIEAVDKASGESLYRFVPVVDGVEEFLYEDNAAADERVRLMDTQPHINALRAIVDDKEKELQSAMTFYGVGCRKIDIISKSVEGMVGGSITINLNSECDIEFVEGLKKLIINYCESDGFTTESIDGMHKDDAAFIEAWVRKIHESIYNPKPRGKRL